MDRYNEALESFDQSLAILRELGDHDTEAMVLQQIETVKAKVDSQ